jgi:uncharacterized protein (TIGR03067 family)
MRRHLFFVLLLAVASIGCASATVTAELGGSELPVASFRGANLRLKADSYDFAGDKGSYVALSGSVPAQMDILGREGPNAGRTIRAIYQLEGDRLTVCYQLGSGDRPVKFVSPSGTQLFLVRYKRIP